MDFRVQNPQMRRKLKKPQKERRKSGPTKPQNFQSSIRNGIHPMLQKRRMPITDYNSIFSIQSEIELHETDHLSKVTPFYCY